MPGLAATTDPEEMWLAPFLATDTDNTPVPYGDLHVVSPFVATPQAAIDLILEELNLGDEDFLVDLGCGHGTINITAAKDYRCPGLGVDIEPKLVEEAQVKAREAGVEQMTTFSVQDVAETDLSPATAIVSFLVQRQLKVLQPKLLLFLARGGKLACYHYRLVGIQPRRTLGLGGEEKKIFIY